MADPSVLRILDANLNRAREALRLIEEVVRFRLDSRWFAAEVKSLRHDLARVAAGVPQSALLAARDAAGDVGAEATTPSETSRADTEAVMTAALKRLQEALRAIEEFGKIIDPDLAGGVERLRFRAYTLEKRLAQVTRPREGFAGARLYVLVTETLCKHPWLDVVRAAIAGGADVVQLREKALPDAEYLRRAEQACEVCRSSGAAFVVNDRVAVAQLVHADAVHVGQDDLPAERVRRLVGPTLAVGVSTHTIAHARSAVTAGADYLGVGPMFATRTKPREPVVGLRFAREVAREIGIPWFALGGIDGGNVGRVVEAGAGRVAVSAAVAGADDPEAAARALRAALPEPT